VLIIWPAFGQYRTLRILALPLASQPTTTPPEVRRHNQNHLQGKENDTESINELLKKLAAHEQRAAETEDALAKASLPFLPLQARPYQSLSF